MVVNNLMHVPIDRRATKNKIHRLSRSNTSKDVFRSLIQCSAACSHLDMCSAFHWDKTQETCSLGSKHDLTQASLSQDTLNSFPVHVNLDYPDPPVTFEGASSLLRTWHIPFLILLV